MLIRSSKLACKNAYGIRTLDSNLEFSSLSPYHLIIMHSHAISALIHALTHISMHKQHLSNRIELREALTNLWNLAKLPKPEFPSQNQAFLAFLPSFFFFLSLVSFLFFSDFCLLFWPLELAEIPLKKGQELV